MAITRKAEQPRTTNGLVDHDRAFLEAKLSALEQLGSRPRNMGHADNVRIRQTTERIRARLNPEQLAKLVEDANIVLRLYVLGGAEPPYWMDSSVIEALRESLG